MFCPNCGNQCPDGTKFCQSCGTPLTNNQQQNTQPDFNNQQANYQQPNYQQPNQQYQQPNYNQYQQPNQYRQPMYNQPYQQYPQYPDKFNGHQMGWYKFLIYFALFAGAFFNVCYAVLYMTGSIYETEQIDPLTVYSLYPGVKAVDIVYGILLLVLAAFMIVTRFQLSGLKKNGPKMVVALYGLNIAIAIIYAILISCTTDYMAFDASTVGQCVIPVVMAIVNKVYFDRRKDIFVN